MSVGTRKSPRLNRVPTQDLSFDFEASPSRDSLIGLTASRLYAKSSSDPGPIELVSGLKEDSIVPQVVEEEKRVPEDTEIEYLIRQRTVGSTLQVFLHSLVFPTSYSLLH
jgi:hypothetical protein